MHVGLADFTTLGKSHRRLPNEVLKCLIPEKHCKELGGVHHVLLVYHLQPVAIVLLPQRGIAKHLVGLPNRLEAGVSLGVVRILIGVELLGEPVVGLLDLRLGSVSGNAKVVIELCVLHHAPINPQGTSPCQGSSHLPRPRIIVGLIVKHQLVGRCLECLLVPCVYPVASPDPLFRVPGLAVHGGGDRVRGVVHPTRNLGCAHHCPGHWECHGTCHTGG
mmetsp:Transcript_13426/g.48850  ORF Transcript_13426/g.48850 Transcript_13426/m.48850 type:complete len:219 (+) Transcript_13426:904-1560(+)